MLQFPSLRLVRNWSYSRIMVLSFILRSVSERRTDEKQNNITFEYYNILPQKHKFIYTGGQNVREKNTSKKRNQA